MALPTMLLRFCVCVHRISGKVEGIRRRIKDVYEEHALKHCTCACTYTTHTNHSHTSHVEDRVGGAQILDAVAVSLKDLGREAPGGVMLVPAASSSAGG
jgi:hypothetical protein